MSRKNLSIVCSFFPTCLAILLLFSSAIASSPEFDWAHSCQAPDHEQLGRELAAGAAAKRPAVSDSGDTRTLRLVYFLPIDRTFNPDVVDSMKARIPRIRTFFRDQMQAHGYGAKTFDIETDDQGDPVVHRVDAPNTDASYLRSYRFVGPGNVLRDLGEPLDGNGFFFIVVDHSTYANLGYGNIAGFGSSRGKNGGYALVPASFTFGTAAHELGHAFGLQHDFNDGANIMSYGPGFSRLSACSAGFLAVHPYFDSDVPTLDAHWTSTIVYEAYESPTIELISPLRYPVGATNMSLQFRISASGNRGLRHAVLFLRTKAPHAAAGSREVKACRPLSGEREAVVTFSYDGVAPSEGSGDLSTFPTHYVEAGAVDSEGNVTDFSHLGRFVLARESTHHLATLIASTDRLSTTGEAVFSRDGTILAVRSSRGIQIWDVATRTQAVLFGEGGSSLAISPDGNTIAVGSSKTYEANIKLWDLASRTLITTLPGHQGGPTGVHSVAFSPDGNVLASGSGDKTVKLWDVSSQTLIATLTGHRSHVFSVAFSLDGTLASGSRDGTVKLWNTATRTNTATLKGGIGRVLDVAFSPGGDILASSTDGPMVLWEVSTGDSIAAVQGKGKASFSPDGTVIATGGPGLGELVLWEAETREKIASLGHPGQLWDLGGGRANGTFSPDGSLLASVVVYGIELWDVSQWTANSTPAPAQAATDFNGDGKTDFADFFLFADAYGGTDARFDLDGSGTVDFADFFKFVDAFGS